MIILVFAILGAGFGVMQARKRGGNRKDIAQYAAGYGIAFCLVGTFLAIVLDRMVF